MTVAWNNGKSVTYPIGVEDYTVGAVIPVCRNIERRWQALDAAGSGELEGRLKFDEVKLWAGAFGIPIVLMLLY